MADAEEEGVREPGLREYSLVSTAVTVFCAGVWLAVQGGAGETAQTEALIAPMLSMFALTALVFVAMVVMRNVAILRGLATVRYYVDYAKHVPSEWIERPARTFNNLMQVPSLFYVVCLLSMITGRIDAAQVSLAWIYVAARAVHAIVYIAINYVPARFGCFVASCIALGVLWTRFALLG